MTARGAVFLDRDGVLVASDIRNGRPHPVDAVGDLRILPGVEQACDLLTSAGWALVVVTNQPDVARGRTPREVVDALNFELERRLPLTAVMTCPHDDVDACACRKPLPGMLVEAARVYGLDLETCVMVGDRTKDIEAGRAARCATVLVDGGHGEPVTVEPDLRSASLIDAVPWINARIGQPRAR